MSKLEDLKAELLSLQSELAAIESEGRVLTDCWIAKAKPGSRKKEYPRLKSRKPMFDGKKTEYLSINGIAVEEAEAAIGRGKTVKKLNKHIQTLTEQISQLQRKSTAGSKKTAQKKAQDCYTPREIIALVRAVLQEIDLDPASDEIAQEWIKAKKYYTHQEDGLSQAWSGRVWLHPPSDGKTAKWTNKLLSEYESAKVIEAVLLVKPSIGSKWFQKLTRQCTVCFPDQRISFVDEQDISQARPKHGNAIFYLGKKSKRFKQVFKTIGSVSSPI